MAELLQDYFSCNIKLLGPTWVCPWYDLSSTFSDASSRSVSIYKGSNNTGTLVKTVTLDDKIITGLEPNTTYFIESTDYAHYCPGTAFTTKAKNNNIVTVDTLHYALAKLYVEGHETITE